MKYKFHNLELSVRQVQHIDAYCVNRSVVWYDVFQNAVELGVKVSFSYNDYHDVVQMSLTPAIEEHPFYGSIVTCRHENFERLLELLFWLLAEGFDQIESSTSSNGRYTW